MSGARCVLIARYFLIACLMLAACDDRGEPSDASLGGADSDAGDAQTLGDASSSDDALRAAVAAFLVTLVAEVPATDSVPSTPAYTSSSGLIYAYEKPSLPIWDLLGEEGGCRLLEPRNPFCDPRCGSGAICADDDTCVQSPTTLDVGTATLRGLNDADGATEVELKPLPPTNSYAPRGSSTLVYPPFAEGDEVTLASEGGDLDPFELTAAGIAPLEVLSASPLLFSPDETTVVRWTPPASDQSARRSHVVVRVDISHHGGNKGELVCEVEDDGELELPSALIQGLIDLGVAGNPSLEVVRESSNPRLPNAPGLVLTILSSTMLELEIPGVISCDEVGVQGVCPTGQVCLQTHICE